MSHTSGSGEAGLTLPLMNNFRSLEVGSRGLDKKRRILLHFYRYG